MQRFPVVRSRLMAGQVLLALLCLALAGSSAWRLLIFPPDAWAAVGLAVLAAALFLIPAVAYRIYLLGTAYYGITNSGALQFQFGPRREIIPIEEIEEIRSGGKIPDSLRSAGPGWWGTWQGRVAVDREDPTDWIATDRGQFLLLLVSKNHRWAISPSDPAEFARQLTELSTRGSLEKVEPFSYRPSPIILDILKTRPALVSLIGGWLLIVALGAFLLAVQPIMPTDQPFRFNPSGAPDSRGDPLRLMILPFTGGAVWLLNAILGWRAWRTDQRLAAYSLWIAACAIAVGLWIAAILLMRAH
jgi:hypothetical protein